MALKVSNKNRKKEQKTIVTEEPVLMPNIRAIEKYKKYIFWSVALVVIFILI